jgi:hypothetical protein
MYGQVVTDENCPTVPGSWALADETAINCATPNQPSAINRTFKCSEEREQDFGGYRRASDFHSITKWKVIIYNLDVKAFFIRFIHQLFTSARSRKR